VLPAVPPHLVFPPRFLPALRVGGDRGPSRVGTRHRARGHPGDPGAVGELRAHAPYLVVLVDAEEGFRLMGHGEPDLRIGDAVEATFVRFAERMVPRFVRSGG
jgi:uncharacterized protein